ncbi:MAG: hypothetical protein H7Y15_19035 [Pseudonocardia sp.]|nr:hypothetical protein [Pseudonocardia sp.]
MTTTRSREDSARLHRRLYAEAAAIIDGWPTVRDRLRAHHVPGRAGRCASCHSVQTAGPRWPCALAVVAGATRRM